MTAPTKRDRYVKVDRKAWYALAWILAGHVLEDIRDLTGWQFISAFVLTAWVMAVVYGLLWLSSRDSA